MMFDPISLLEEAYQPQRDAHAWLRANAPKIVVPIDDSGLGAIQYFVRDFLVDTIDVEFQPGVERRLELERAIKSLIEGMSESTPEKIPQFVLAMQQPGAHGFVETFGGLTRALREVVGPSIRDSPAVIIPTGERVVAVVAAFTKEPLSLSRDLRALWQQIAIHLGAACRLSGRSEDFGAPDIEAIIDVGGKVVDARGHAAAKSARERLREGVRRMDRARALAGRANPLGALVLWKALIAGRWSLVDRTDTDGRRFVLARRNEPHPSGPAALSRRQQQVLFYASVGWSLKQIAYALGLSSEGSVTPHLRAGLNKLGFNSRTELIRATTDLAMQTLASTQAGEIPDSLAEAERMDAALAAAGWSNEQIAKRRGVSVHTVANQLTSVYRKTGVRDRYELAAWLSARRRR